MKLGQWKEFQETLGASLSPLSSLFETLLLLLHAPLSSGSLPHPGPAPCAVGTQAKIPPPRAPDDPPNAGSPTTPNKAGVPTDSNLPVFEDKFEPKVTKARSDTPMKH